MNDQLNPHIENLRQAFAIVARTDPGGAAVCNTGLSHLLGQHDRLIAERDALLAACRRIVGRLGSLSSRISGARSHAIDRQTAQSIVADFREILTAAIADCEQPKPQEPTDAR